MSLLDAYSPDYSTARARFRERLGECGWEHEAHTVSATGFADGELSIDVGRIGPADARHLLVLSSGLHGGEGPFGSAVQMAWLNSLPKSWAPPAGCAVVLLHALNPYGFAACRRANEENVDLNRNFLAPDEFERLRDKTAREFGPLDPYLNPSQPPGRINWFPLVFSGMVWRFGLPFLHSVMPAGQYAFPKGIFYGGQGRSQSTQILTDAMPRWLGSAHFVVHLDFHTGLGKFAGYKLLASDPVGSAQAKLARELFGRERVLHDHETEDGYHNFGDMGEWLSQRFSDRTYLYLCAEFGTFGTTRVIGALRRENQAHFWEPRESARYRQIKEQALEVFTPRSSAWRWPVLRQSLDLIQTSINICTDRSKSPK